MQYNTNAKARWDALDNKRRGFISRCEKYASFTVPKVCLPDGYDENNVELQHDYQSVGAQAVRHLVNKMMLALFAPSRPAMRLELTLDGKKELGQAGLTESDMIDTLAVSEREAWKGIDREPGMRPKLYESLTHLVVTGNSLQDTTGDLLRVIGIKGYVCKRNQQGKVIEVLTKDCVTFEELADEVQAVVPQCKPDEVVEHYRWCRLVGKKYIITQWVNQNRLPKEFDGIYPEDKLPLRPLTWDLADGNHYGTGLVEDYQGDFAALSMMSEALVKAAIIASEFRWLVNPSGLTKPEDLENSENGAALPGQNGDITLVNAQTAQAVPHIQTTAADYINRIGRGFLLQGAVTRNAERVTAEEIRMQAQELETSLGGAYSRIAVDMQTPLALYLLRKVGFAINGKALQPHIVTGLDALSRSSDLDNLKLFVADVIQVGTLPPEIRTMLNLERILKAMAAGRGLSASEYLSSNPQPTAAPPDGTAVEGTASEQGVSEQ